MQRMMGIAGLILGIAALSAHAELHVQAGGGWQIPTGDSARFFYKGYRLDAGIEYHFDNQIGLLLSGAYAHNRVNGDKVNEENNAIPAVATVTGNAHIYELNLSPKFYLVDSPDMGVYFMAGGGPRWFAKKITITPPAGSPASPVIRETSERSLALQIGFGGEAALPGSFRIGLNPLYHIAFAKTRVQYTGVTVYLKF